MTSPGPLYASDTPRQTIVEEGTELDGILRSSCPLVIGGELRGKISAPEITVRRLGSVSGVIKTERLTSSGTLSGQVEAAHVLVTGRVRSHTNIKAQHLDVTLRSERGQLEIRFGSPVAEAVPSEALPAEAAVVEATLAEASPADPSSEPEPSAAPPVNEGPEPLASAPRVPPGLPPGKARRRRF